MMSKVLRSEVIMPVSRPPLTLSFFFYSLLEFWLYKPCNYVNYFYFSLMHMLSFVDDFCPMCMLCMLPLSMQCSIFVVV